MITIARKSIKGMGMAAFVLACVVYLFPVLWMIVSSFKTRSDIFSGAVSLNFAPTLDNYKTALLDSGYLSNLLNSILIAGGSVVVALVLGVPAAYSLARHRLRYESAYLFALLSSRLISPMVIIVPIFVLANSVGMVGSRWAVLAAYLTFVTPFVVWMMRGFFLHLPTSVIDSAFVDGCGEFGAFCRIALPLVRGGLAATAIFCLVTAWNDFLYAIILSDSESATLPAAIPQLKVPTGTFWGQIMAVGTTTVIPVIVFAVFAQRHIVTGMTAGALSDE